MSSDKRKHETVHESARAGRHAGSGAPGRQGLTPEHSPGKRRGRTATGTSSTERDHGRSRAEREGREHTEGTG
jgi:hypothetical protein